MEHRPRARIPVIRCGESGTTVRFLATVAALRPEAVRFEGTPQLSRRPIEDLYCALRKLGAAVRSPSPGRALPCTIRGPLHSGTVAIRGDVSSQFTSALLMALPRASGRSELHVLGSAVSRPYVAATRAVLGARGVRVRRTRKGFVIPGDQEYRPGRFDVPGDASSAAYLWAAAAVTGGRVDVEGIELEWPQADLAILPILAEMGAHVRRSARSCSVEGPISRPVSVDLTDSPDLVPLVSVLAAFAPGRRSHLRGAPQLAFKESDRRTESVGLARAFGAKVRSTGAHIEIVGPLSPAAVALPTLEDHRLVMSAAVGGLGAEGVSRIGRAEAVSKSFPGFWNALATLTQRRESVP